MEKGILCEWPLKMYIFVFYIFLKFKGYHYLGAVVCIFISKHIRWILRLRFQTVLTGFVTFHWRGLQEKPASPPQQLHSDIIILWPSLKNRISSSWNNTKSINPMSMRTFWHYITQSFILEETMLVSFENSDRIPSSKLITKKVYRGHENWFHCLIMSNKIQRNLICLTTGSHSWNITYTLTHFFLSLFLYSLSLCNKNSSILFQINLFNCSHNKEDGPVYSWHLVYW